MVIFYRKGAKKNYFIFWYFKNYILKMGSSKQQVVKHRSNI